MNIEAKDYKIEMTYSELWDVAFDVKHALINTIRTHWVSYQDKWEKSEERRIYRLKVLFSALGRHELFDEIEREVDLIFKEYNETKKS